jgi:hypothetical protein
MHREKGSKADHPSIYRHFNEITIPDQQDASTGFHKPAKPNAMLALSVHKRLLFGVLGRPEKRALDRISGWLKHLANQVTICILSYAL